MSLGLRRYYGRGHLHFITFSCYRRRPLLASPRWRELFLRTLEKVRQQLHFKVVGYVVMPEHVHLLISEPELGDPSGAVQLLKQKTSHRMSARRRRLDPRQGSLLEEARDPVWQRRFYDFNVFTVQKRAEKLRYMHNNPVKRGLVARAADWKWSSYLYYQRNHKGIVIMNQT